MGMFKSNLSKEEVFEEFSRYFALRGWNVSTSYGVVSAEHGKNINSWLVAFLLLLGVSALWATPLVALFMALAVVYYFAAERHRAALACKGEGVFETSANSKLARRLLNEFILALEREGKASVVEKS